MKFQMSTGSRSTFALLILIAFSLSAVAETRIAVFNDLNAGVGSDEYYGGTTTGIRNLLATSPDIVVAPGDLVGGEDFSKRLTDTDFRCMWASFDKNVHALIKQKKIPFAPAPGNHDANAGLTREVANYKEYFQKSGNKPDLDFVDATYYPYFYAYVHKNVFFVALDATLSGTLKSSQVSADAQKAWLRKQLASPRAVSARARISYAHVPIYSVLDQKRHAGKFSEVLSSEQVAKGGDKSLEAILVDGDVDLAIFGHSHVFYPGLVRYSNSSSTLHMLFAPRGGPGGRYLPGATTMSPQGFALIRVQDNGQIVYEARDYTGKVMKCSSLPSTIASNGGRRIERDSEYCK